MSNESSLSAALVDPEADQAIEQALIEIGSPGSFFSAAERLDVAAAARAARGLGGSPSSIPADVAEQVTRIAVEAMKTRPEHLAAWEAEGREILAYVELVAIVARISAIDSYRVGLDAELDPLPEPVPGEPAPAVDEKAVKTNAWVATVGPAVAPSALSALPNEKAAQAALAARWYLTDDVIHKYDVEPGREITRPQMEFVAARTSWLNECFF